MLQLTMESALSAQAKFSPKKAYNLEVFTREESSEMMTEGKTKNGKKEVSVVGNLYAGRDVAGAIVSFVLRVGETEMNLDMSAIDEICGGFDGRDLFYLRIIPYGNMFA